jgi:hypothetical protein
MDISKLSLDEALKVIEAIEDIESLRLAAQSVDLRFSGNTGVDTLRKNLTEHVKNKSIELDALSEEDGNEKNQVTPDTTKKKAPPTVEELLEMDVNKIEDPQLLRRAVRAKALRLVRVRITNLDPNDQQLPGAIITVMNKYTGKVSRFISFGDENNAGTHVEQILINFLKQQKFTLHKPKKDSVFGVKSYITRTVPKYAIEELPPLTEKELKELATQQRASHAISD